MRIAQVRCSAMPGMPVSALYTNSYHYRLLLTTYYRSPEKGNGSAAADARLSGKARRSGKSILDCGSREQRHGDGSESGLGAVSCPY